MASGRPICVSGRETQTGGTEYSCPLRQPIALVGTRDRPIQRIYLMEAKLFRATHRSGFNCGTSAEEQWVCSRVQEKSKQYKNFFEFDFGRHSYRTISLGTESNLGHRVSGVKPRQPSVSARWSRYASKNGQKTTQKGQLVLSVTTTSVDAGIVMPRQFQPPQ